MRDKPRDMLLEQQDLKSKVIGNVWLENSGSWNSYVLKLPGLDIPGLNNVPLVVNKETLWILEDLKYLLEPMFYISNKFIQCSVDL